MAAHRVDKMASSIRRIVGDIISNELSDPRVSRLASITRVELSGDLQVAKVYVSVMGDDAEARRTMAGLRHAEGYSQRLLAKELSIRRCPEVRFILDESIKTAARTSRLIDEALGRTGENAHAGDEAAPQDDAAYDDAGEDPDGDTGGLRHGLKNDDTQETGPDE